MSILYLDINEGNIAVDDDDDDGREPIRDLRSWRMERRKEMLFVKIICSSKEKRKER
jgi:hypothetical protein